MELESSDPLLSVCDPLSAPLPTSWARVSRSNVGFPEGLLSLPVLPDMSGRY